MEHASLKARQREEREGCPTNLALRVHRSLSGLQRAELCDDLDGKFIFLWIAFNAAYANELGDQDRPRERELFEQFLGKLIGLDHQDSLNRDQLRVCTAFLGKLVPYIIQLMMDHPDTVWGDACYPVVDAD